MKIVFQQNFCFKSSVQRSNLAYFVEQLALYKTAYPARKSRHGETPSKTPSKHFVKSENPQIAVVPSLVEGTLAAKNTEITGTQES